MTGNASLQAQAPNRPLGEVIGELDDAITGALLLCEDVEQGAFLNSRLTRLEVRRLVSLACALVDQQGPMLRQAVPEVDLEAWQCLSARLGGDTGRSTWNAVQALLPETLTWLRVARAGTR